MPRAQVVEPEVTDEELRRGQILDAAMQCFIQLGIARTSVQDVARMAGVSRGTVYRYFDDRQLLIDAAVEHGAQQYYADAAALMATKDTLAEQAGAIAEVVARTLLEHRTRNRLMSDDAELMRHIIAGSDATVRRTAAFLLPYVEAAQERGEVGADVDPEEASEWLARMINSLSTVQTSPTFDMTKPKAVGKFVARFAVSGLT